MSDEPFPINSKELVETLYLERDALIDDRDRLHRILAHIAEHGASGDRVLLIRKWGMSAIGTTPEDRVKILIEDVEKEMNKPQNERS